MASSNDETAMALLFQSERLNTSVVSRLLIPLAKRTNDNSSVTQTPFGGHSWKKLPIIRVLPPEDQIHFTDLLQTPAQAREAVRSKPSLLEFNAAE